MAKYPAAFLLVAVAAFLTPAAARPQDILLKVDDLVNEVVDYVLKKIQDGPEPSTTRLRELLQETKRRDWSSVQQFEWWFSIHVNSIYSDFESKEESYEYLDRSEFARTVYAGLLVAIAPTNHKMALEQKLDVIVKEYEGNDFIEESQRIFQEVTGADYEELRSQFD